MKRLFFSAALALALTACTHPTPDAQHKPVVYQNSTIDELLEGDFAGDVTFAQVLQHGDFGLGTFDALDGEMIGFDGRFYQIRSDGHVQAVPDQARTPFAAVSFFHADHTAAVHESLTLPQLQKRLDGLRTNDSQAFAFRIDGQFTYMKTRSVPRQHMPYRRLAEVVKEQSIFQWQEIRGTLVGFWFPQTLRHVNVPGYHFHFLSQDHTKGGHVLDCQLREGTVQVQDLTAIWLEMPHHLPGSVEAAATQPATQNDELEKAEK